jgi:nucleotide-binding universal stress UspA family protein
MKRVIVPLDGIELTPNSLALAALFAHLYHAELELMHVIDDPRVPATVGAEKDPQEAFLQRASAAVVSELAVRTRIFGGDPVEQVLDYASENLDSLLVVPAHGKSGLTRAVRGSVSDQIVRRSPVPVVVTREAMRFPNQAIRSILVPLDSSPLSERALPWAIELAGLSGATLGLVTVVDTHQLTAALGIDYRSEAGASVENETRDLARSYLDAKVRELRADELRVTWEVRVGRPADEIIRAARTTEADLIVMSSHGRGGVRRWAFGSVTDDIVRRGHTPVFVAPASASLTSH